MKYRKCTSCRKSLALTRDSELCEDCQSRYERMYGKSSKAPGAGPSSDDSRPEAETNVENRENVTMKKSIPHRRDRNATAASTKKHAKQPAAIRDPGPVDDVDDEDEDELEASGETEAAAEENGANGTPSKYSTSYQARMRKLSPAKQYETKAKNSIERLNRIKAAVSGWSKPELVKSVDHAIDALEELVEELGTLPDDFKPPAAARAPSAAKPLDVGTTVAIREKVSEKYDDIIEPKDREGMKVVTTKKSRVLCQTRSGEKVLIPRGHLSVAAA